MGRQVGEGGRRVSGFFFPVGLSNDFRVGTGFYWVRGAKTVPRGFRRFPEDFSRGSRGFPGCGAYSGLSGNAGPIRWLLFPVKRRFFGSTSGLGHVG